MAYDKTKDVSAGYISPQHKKLLQTLSVVHKRSKRRQLEYMIEQQAKQDNVKEDEV